MVENHCASLARTCIYMPVSVNGRGTYDAYWGQALVCVSLLYFLINPHNRMRCHQFLSFSNEETLTQGVGDFLKASQQTNGAGICLPRPSMPALYGSSVLYHSGKKSMHHKIILTSFPGCFQICAISLLSPTADHNPPCGFLDSNRSQAAFEEILWCPVSKPAFSPSLPPWPLTRFRVLITS